jgi:tetratricopeptide (TPR) repeat protein
MNHNARHFFELSRITYYWGDFVAAKKWAQDALEEAKKAGNEEYICLAKRRLGLVALHQQNLELATIILQDTWNESLRIKERITIAPYAAALGELAESQADLRTAQSWYDQAVQESRNRNDLPALALDLIHLGRVTFALGQAAKAQTLLAESLRISREETAQVDVAAKALYQIAVVENHLGVTTARGHAREALDLFRRLGMKREQTDAEALLAKLAEQSQAS